MKSAPTAQLPPIIRFSLLHSTASNSSNKPHPLAPHPFLQHTIENNVKQIKDTRVYRSVGIWKTLAAIRSLTVGMFNLHNLFRCEDGEGEGRRRLALGGMVIGAVLTVEWGMMVVQGRRLRMALDGADVLYSGRGVASAR